MSRRYPCYSSTALMSLMGLVLTGVYSLCTENKNWSSWKLAWNIRLLAAAYSVFPVMLVCYWNEKIIWSIKLGLDHLSHSLSHILRCHLYKLSFFFLLRFLIFSTQSNTFYIQYFFYNIFIISFVTLSLLIHLLLKKFQTFRFFFLHKL